MLSTLEKEDGEGQQQSGGIQGTCGSNKCPGCYCLGTRAAPRWVLICSSYLQQPTYLEALAVWQTLC